MRTARPFVADPGSPRLAHRRFDDREELWTETVGSLPPVYGEGWEERDGRWYRRFEPARSKLSAALVSGWSGPCPVPGNRWLYLGAASGTTASHVADLVGPGGTVYAVEPSVRPFARLRAAAERWPNLRPILADARRPEEYADLVPPVDGIYADIAQPDQVEIVRRNLALLARPEGVAVLIALKTPSMGRERAPPAHRAAAERELAAAIELAPSVRLDPFHRGHYLIGGVTPGGGPRRPAGVTRRAGSIRARRRS